jgi:membrane protein
VKNTRKKRQIERWLRRSWWWLGRLYQAYALDGVSDRAATLAYYFVFSLFPFLVFLTTLLAYVPQVRPATVSLIERIGAWLPSSATAIVEEQLHSLVETSRPHWITLGLVAAIFSASRAVHALRRALNLAARVYDERPWWYAEILVVSITIAGGVLVIVAATALLLGSELAHWLSLHLRSLIGGEEAPSWLAQPFDVYELWVWLRWPVMACAMSLLTTLTYRWLPAKPCAFRELAPGVLAASILWVVVTYVFTLYVDVFATYSVMYGSLGGVIVLMVWAYLSALIYLLGAEFNALLLRK